MKIRKALAAAALGAVVAATSAAPAAALTMDSSELPGGAMAEDVTILVAGETPNDSPWNGHSRSAGTESPLRN